MVKGIKPVSPALAGRFLTTGPSGKSRNTLRSVLIDMKFLIDIKS